MKAEVRAVPAGSCLMTLRPSGEERASGASSLLTTTVPLLYYSVAEEHLKWRLRRIHMKY